MAEATPELFSDGTCGRRLPAGELLQEFRFGQFSPLRQIQGGVETPVVVGKTRTHEPKSASNTFAVRSLGGIAQAEKRVISLAELLAGDQAGSMQDPNPITLELHPEHVVTAIATRRVSL